MSANDFDPKRVTRQFQDWEGRSKVVEAYPAVGSKVAIVLIEADGAAANAIAAKLVEIEALATRSKTLAWTPTAEAGKRPKVEVRVTVKTDEAQGV